MVLFQFSQKITISSFSFPGLTAYATVLTFFEQERNMFYRHKAALMYDHKSLVLASFWSELPFILLVGMIFSVCFYFPLGKVISNLNFLYFE
jgi:ABC-type multidrug transport system permease subunit